MKGQENGDLILPFSAIDRNALSVSGGKAANLGELIRAGFPVPPGFCVTTHAYTLATAGADLGPVLDVLAATSAEETARLAEHAAAAHAIRWAYGALGERDGPVPVAVRSSATAEDLPFASFAGQQDTYLNVVGADALLDAVRRCWASLWTDRAVAYRASNAIEPGSVRLAVVVQRLIDAAVAGVVFTANPLTGKRRETVVDASPGLGEAVVSGLVNPDHFVVDTVTGNVRERH